FVIKNLYKLEDKPRALTDGIFKKLFKEASVANLQQREKEQYEESLKAYLDWYNVLNSAKNAGVREGEAKGRAEGLAEGAKKQAIETARNAKALGLPVETIAQLSGLSEDEINGL
ncbi:MAG: PD-(D/E)XK nuclease family transposase, partial [Bacteroidales bacterium]|nr:PD-(D/E)XK nuclease family transposase [Bacteroidales bacterium]